jgi:hypothetical protein
MLFGIFAVRDSFASVRNGVNFEIQKAGWPVAGGMIGRQLGSRHTSEHQPV